MTIKFKCPWCEHTVLRQVRRFATVSQDVTDVTESTMKLSLEHNIAGGNAPQFECGNCGTSLHIGNKPITEIKDLFDTLQAIGMLED